MVAFFYSKVDYLESHEPPASSQLVSLALISELVPQTSAEVTPNTVQVPHFLQDDIEATANAAIATTENTFFILFFLWLIMILLKSNESSILDYYKKQKLLLLLKCLRLVSFMN